VGLKPLQVNRLGQKAGDTELHWTLCTWRSTLSKGPFQLSRTRPEKCMASHARGNRLLMLFTWSLGGSGQRLSANEWSVGWRNQQWHVAQYGHALTGMAVCLHSLLNLV